MGLAGNAKVSISKGMLVRGHVAHFSVLRGSQIKYFSKILWQRKFKFSHYLSFFYFVMSLNKNGMSIRVRSEYQVWLCLNPGTNSLPDTRYPIQGYIYYMIKRC